MSDVNPVVGVMDDAIDFVRKANDRTYAAEVRVKELEAQCAAMREALRPERQSDDDADVFTCNECGESFAIRDGCVPTPECDSCAHSILASARSALSGDAGRALLERVEALERVAEAAMALIGDLPRNAIEYDSLKAELIKRVDALEPKR